VGGRWGKSRCQAPGFRCQVLGTGRRDDSELQILNCELPDVEQSGWKHQMRCSGSGSMPNITTWSANKSEPPPLTARCRFSASRAQSDGLVPSSVTTDKLTADDFS